MKRNTLILTLSFFLLAACVSVKEDSSNWLPLKPLADYSSKDFKLREDLQYLEVREYTESIRSLPAPYRTVKKPFNANEYKILYKIYQKPLASFGNDIVKRFKALKPNLTKTTDIKRSGGGALGLVIRNLSNLFYILNNGNKVEVGSKSRISEVLPLLGEIDRPAEAQMVLWLHNKHEGKSYRKVSNGYEVLIEYENAVINFGECGWFRYRAHIGRHGKILEYKLLKKRKLKGGCAII